MAACSEALDCSNPGTTELEHLEENLGALKIDLKDDVFREIEDGFSKIHLQGARVPEDLMALVDVGAKLEARSIAT